MPYFYLLPPCLLLLSVLYLSSVLGWLTFQKGFVLLLASIIKLNPLVYLFDHRCKPSPLRPLKIRCTLFPCRLDKCSIDASVWIRKGTPNILSVD